MQSNFQSRRDRSDTKVAPRSELRTQVCPVDEAAPAEVMKNFTSGVVTECTRLNVRKTPSLDSEVVSVIDFFTDVVVDLESSTDEFYKVITAAGVEGFCMKKYIALQK